MINTTDYLTISYDDAEFSTKLVEAFKEYGVVVISNVMPKSVCDNHVDKIVTTIENLGTGVKRNKCKETWTDYNLPPQTRPGLFQACLANLEPVWEIRSDPKILNIFSILYSNLRKKELKSYSDFIVSGDAINIRPNDLFDPNISGSDWPHLDQVDRSDIFKCIQGQMVLTNTTASFVASPKSHKVYLDIVNKYNIPNDYGTNWWRIINNADATVDEIKELIKSVGGKWQIPILAEAGSFIIWSSTLVHSARLQTKKEKKNINDEWLGWRCVVYVSYRPKEEYTEHDLIVRQQAYEDNLTTNHWGNKTFKKNPKINRFKKTGPVHANIKAMIDNPKILYTNQIVKPNLNTNSKILLGYENTE